jgi:hypothetical protein
MIRGNLTLPYLNDIISGSKFYEIDGKTRAVGQFKGLVSKIQKPSIFCGVIDFVYEITIGERKLLSYFNNVFLECQASSLEELSNLEKLVFVTDSVEIIDENHSKFGCGELSVDSVSYASSGINCNLTQLCAFGEEKEFEDNLSCEIDRVFNYELNSEIHFKRFKKRFENLGIDVPYIFTEQDLKKQYGEILRDGIKKRFSLKENISKKKLEFFENRHFTVLDSQVKIT